MPNPARARATGPATIDEYLSGVGAAERAALEALRATIHETVPEAEECISYQLPAFRLGGRPLVAFGARAKHCAFYPMSGSIVDAFREELAAYDTGKGCVRFPASRPLPAALVRALVRARLAEHAAA